MTTKDELELILNLIKKYDLPLSPILEYAINEKIESYISDTEESSGIISEPLRKLPEYKGLDKYKKDFASLSVGISGGRKLPHKATLLIGIIHLIENGTICNNKIPLNKSISDVFTDYWHIYFNNNTVPSVWTPFYHLKSEPFWHFKAADTEERLKMLLSFGGTPSVGKMRPIIEYAYFDDDLFSLLKDERSRTQIREVLINTYLSDNIWTDTNVHSSNIDSAVNGEVLFKKVLDWSMFNAGTTIPVKYHEAIQSVCDERIKRGESKKVNIRFEDKDYDAILISSNIKTRDTSCLQLIWARNSPLAQKLRAKYSDVYDCLLSQRVKAPGKKPILPENLKYELVFCKSSSVNNYLLLQA